VSIVRVNQMASDSNVGVTGVAALNPKQIAFHKGCAALGETLYCAVEESAMGTIEQQTRATLGRLGANVKGAGFRMEDASATQLYLDNVDDFEKMNAAYASLLAPPRPARATLQPAPSGQRRLVQISVVVSR